MSNYMGRRGYVGGTLSLSLSLVGISIGGFYLHSHVDSFSSSAFVIGSIGALIGGIGMFIMFLQYAIYGNGSSNSKIVNSANKGRGYHPSSYDVMTKLSLILSIGGLLILIIFAIIGFSSIKL